jgi:hypothetical protein
VPFVQLVWGAPTRTLERLFMCAQWLICLCSLRLALLDTAIWLRPVAFADTTAPGPCAAVPGALKASTRPSATAIERSFFMTSFCAFDDCKRKRPTYCSCLRGKFYADWTLP